MRDQACGWRCPGRSRRVTKVNVASVNSSDYKSRVLTSDVNLVELHFAVQYQFSDPMKTLFRVREPEQTLSEVSESAIREIVGRSTLDDVLVGATRPEITRRTKELIQHTLDYYNSGITRHHRQPRGRAGAGRGDPLAARRQQGAGRQGALRARKPQAYANGIIPVAQGAAARMQQDAQAYKAQVSALAEGQAARFTQLEAAYAQAPEVTRRRMYMDTLESVLARSHKVLIDSQAPADGNLIYLPIDKLLDKSVAREAEQAAEPAAGNAQTKEQDQVTVEARGRGER